ncbi:uncharacterized protein METZ01_LOCUS239986, partial [marine metagenome]
WSSPLAPDPKARVEAGVDPGVP